jgi:hypothetical protein
MNKKLRPDRETLVARGVLQEDVLDKVLSLDGGKIGHTATINYGLALYSNLFILLYFYIVTR